MGILYTDSSRVLPCLAKLIVQRWDSSVRSPVYRIAKHYNDFERGSEFCRFDRGSNHVATRVVFLPSRHEGGEIELRHGDKKMSISPHHFPYWSISISLLTTTISST